MNFRPGELDQLITFERKQRTADGMGGYTETTVLVGEVWAHVRPLSGKEITDYDRVNAEARYMFVIRWPLAVFESDNIVWEGERYNIRALKKPKQRDLYCVIEADRGVAM